MQAIACIGVDGPLFQANLEDPRFSLSDPATWESIGIGRPTAAGVRVSTSDALAYPPLWRALNLISGDVGRLPLCTYRRTRDDGKEKARQHPAYPLLRRRPNPVMRASAFKRTLTYHALFHGNGCALIVRDGRGDPRELLILDPEQTGLAIVEGDLWYFTTIAGEPRRFPGRDVFHIKGLSHNGLWGVNVFDLMREALGLPIAAREFMARFFGDGSAQGGVLMVPASFTDDKIKNTLQMWNETATGIAKQHKVALLKDNVKWVPTTHSPKDSETTGILNHEIRTVSAITGCPPHKLGDDSRTSYNSLEQENQSYLDDCLDPWLNEWEEESDLKLLGEAEQASEEYFHEFNRTARLRTDATARGEFYSKLREIGVLTANDICRRENLPTIGPEGDLRFRPANWVPLGESGPAEQARARRRTRVAHRRLVEDVVGKKSEIERTKVLKAAAREEDFTQWLGQFYHEHLQHLVQSLDAVMCVLQVHSGRRWRWTDSVADLCSARQLELLAVSKQSLPERAVAVAAIVDGWSDDALITQLVTPRKVKPCRS